MMKDQCEQCSLHQRYQHPKTGKVYKLCAKCGWEAIIELCNSVNNESKTDKEQVDEPICPHCKGEKGWNKLITPEWMEPPEYQWNICQTCLGKGKITQLQEAVYKARGGPAPIQLTGG